MLMQVLSKPASAYQVHLSEPALAVLTCGDDGAGRAEQHPHIYSDHEIDVLSLDTKRRLVSQAVNPSTATLLYFTIHYVSFLYIEYNYYFIFLLFYYNGYITISTHTYIIMQGDQFVKLRPFIKMVVIFFCSLYRES